MGEALKIKTLFLILIASILFTSLNAKLVAKAQHIQTSLTITNPPYLPREMECAIEATLIDENDSPLQNFDIKFFYECDDHPHLICSAKTDSNGVASIELADDIPPFFNFPRLGTFETKKTVMFKINAMFNGTATYAESSSEDVYVAFVLTDYTSYLVGGVLIAVVIIGVAGYIMLRRRKRTAAISKATQQA
jgi:hypothetical protein